MKIAITTDRNLVAQHFGHCPEYTLVELENGKILSREVIPNPGHQPDFYPVSWRGRILHYRRRIGQRAIELFNQENIEVIVGIDGPVDQAIDDHLAGKLMSRESLCDHDSNPEGHRCR